MTALGWIISIATLAQQWCMTRKLWWAPVSGMCLQGLWIWYTVATRQWGIAFLSVAYVGVYAASIRRWRRERD